ncbi:MAG: hypothetical protein K9I85_11680 [Saprospiraceae bacterium]|nr:hypothetical protein [Saprospiraceae bacterium]
MQFFGMFLLAGGLFLTSCTDDTTDPTPTAATVSLGTGAGFISGNAEIETGSTFNVNVIATSGTNPMKALTVYKDNVAMDFNDLTFNGSGATSNPALLFNTDKTSLNWEIGILGEATDGSHDYKFEILDDNGLTNSVTINIITKTTATPLEKTLMGVLFNQAGPTGTGGLDLDNGTSLGSANVAVEIRDMGIDCGLPDATNWRKQIGSANSADMRKVDLTVLPAFTFAATVSKEAILEAYTTGTVLGSGMTDNCTTPVSVNDVSAPVVVGDMFVVLSNSKYYLIQVAKLNNTTTNNDDNYEMNVKY